MSYLVYKESLLQTISTAFHSLVAGTAFTNLAVLYEPYRSKCSFFHACYFIRDKVAACAKHYVGDGGTTRGINENNTVTDLHGLLSVHMPAYADAIYKGVSTVMVSYSSWNGEKMHANTELITGYLKGTLKFKVCLLFYSSDVSHNFKAHLYVLAVVFLNEYHYISMYFVES